MCFFYYSKDNILYIDYILNICIKNLSCYFVVYIDFRIMLLFNLENES